MSKVDKVYQGWLNLNETEKQELINHIQQDFDLAKRGLHKENIKKGFDLGPIGQNHCPCCGK